MEKDGRDSKRKWKFLGSACLEKTWQGFAELCLR
jgi:hypothetical protein